MTRRPTAVTRVAGVIGDPVEHSLSPVIHNAALAEMGLDWVYVAFHVPAGAGRAAVEAVRTLGLAGLSVTMPHKGDAAEAVDRLTPLAAQLASVNTVGWTGQGEGAELVGDSTDGPGFLDSLAEDGFDPTGRICTVLGTGGASRAVVAALAGAGAEQVRVVGRRPEATAAVAALAGTLGEAVVVGAEDELRRAVGEADLLVNATPVGMTGTEAVPFGIADGWLRSSQFVADLIYWPAQTPLLLAARRAAAPHCNGLGMLIHQAARQLEMWTGRPAPLEAMSVAALGALAHRTR